MIQARVLADSVNEWGDRLTTIEAEFPRIILSEVNTHRKISKNSASSRAIPTSKLLDRVRNDPFIPKRFPVNKSGMSATEYIGPDDGDAWTQRKNVWTDAAYQATESAEVLLNMGVHKQIANRLLEPFMWHKAILSSTSYQNFFDLRISEFAQPEIRATAEAIKAALDASIPTLRKKDEWHLPLTGFEGDDMLSLGQLIKASVARTARVSYLTHDGVRDVEKDITMFDQLAANKHLSPFEHIATPSRFGSGNFDGWTQARYYVEQGGLDLD